MIRLLSAIYKLLLDSCRKISRHSRESLRLCDRVLEMLLQVWVAVAHMRRIGLDELFRSNSNHRCRYINRVAERSLRILKNARSTDGCSWEKADDCAQRGMEACCGDAAPLRFLQHPFVDSVGHRTVDKHGAHSDELVELPRIYLLHAKAMRLLRVMHRADAYCPSAKCADDCGRDSQGGIRRETLGPPDIYQQAKCYSGNDPSRNKHSIENSFHHGFRARSSSGSQIYQLERFPEAASAQ